MESRLTSNYVSGPDTVDLIDGENLKYGKRLKTRRIDDVLLDSLVEVVDGESAARFVRRYGILDRQALSPCDDYELDPIEPYIEMARKVAAVRGAIAAVNAGEPAHESDIRTLARYYKPRIRFDRRRSTEKKELLFGDRLILAQVVNAMMNAAPVLPQVTVLPDNRYAVLFGSHIQLPLGKGYFEDLRGPIAIGLMSELIGETGRLLAVCANCSRVFGVTRRPAAGRKSYCTKPECQRAISRESKRRKAAERMQDGEQE